MHFAARVLPLSMALATTIPRAPHLTSSISNTGAQAIPAPPDLAAAKDVAPPEMAGPSWMSRDVRQVAQLVPTVGVAGVLATIITYMLAPLTGPYAQGFKIIFAGAVAGIISRTFCAPLEMISTVIMCGKGGQEGLVKALRNVWNTEGLKGLFKGNGANILKVAPSRGLQFLVYEAVKRWMIAGGAVLTPQARLFAAGVAGMSAAAVVYPLDVAKTLLTLYPDRCTGVKSALGYAAKSGGLYRGLGPTLVAMFPYVGVEFMVYETLKAYWETMIGATAGTAALLMLGAIGGAASQTVAHPLDVVRRRLQMLGMRKTKGDDDDEKPPYTNMLNGLYHIGSTEGLGTLYAGLAPTCLEKVPSTAIGYFIYEGMKVALGLTSA